MMWAPLLIFLTFTTLLSGAIAALPPLNLEKDTKDHHGNPVGADEKSYSSNLKLTEPTCMTSFTDDNLVWLVKKAYEDMLEKYPKDHPKEDSLAGAPGAMVVFAPGGENKIYLGSSVKGVLTCPEEYFVSKHIIDWFNKCGPHRTDGSCGEFNTLQGYFDGNPAPECRVPGDSRIVAWVNGRLAPPCSKDDYGKGCRDLLEHFALRAITSATEGINPTTGTEPVETLKWVGKNEKNTNEWVTVVKAKGKRKC